MLLTRDEKSLLHVVGGFARHQNWVKSLATQHTSQTNFSHCMTGFRKRVVGKTYGILELKMRPIFLTLSDLGYSHNNKGCLKAKGASALPLCRLLTSVDLYIKAFRNYFCFPSCSPLTTILQWIFFPLR